MLYITILEPNLMYRSRLGKNLNEITLNYVSSIRDDLEIALYDILGSQAHVIMLLEKKIITKKDGKKILIALEKIKNENFEKKSSSEDIHELVETLVIKKAGLESGGKMHTARSRNDQISLDVRMKIRDDINILCNCLLDTIEALLSLAQKNQKTIMPLYTHLQQAQAGTFSHYLLAQADTLFRDFERLCSTYQRINQSPLGAGPVGGTSIPIDRQMTAQLLGFDGLIENSIDATSTRDFAAEYISGVAILMTNLSRLAEDFVIWSTSEFSFIELSDEFSSPSSVMPQKKNPDILELTRGKTAEIIGNLMAILATIKGLATGYGRDLQQIKPAIWSTSKISTSALVVIKSMLLTTKVNDKIMRQATESGYLIALDIAEKLVRKGIPFRTSHKISGQLVNAAFCSSKNLSHLTLNEIKKSLKGIKIDSTIVQEIIKSTTIVSSLQDRTSQGSSGFSEQKRMIKVRLEQVNEYRRTIKNQEKIVSKAFENLTKKLKNLSK